MSWDQSLISGPIEIPVYGTPVADQVTGALATPITGYLSSYCIVVAATFVTPATQPYAQVVPPGVPVLAGVPSVALVFPDEATAIAQPDLAPHWTS